MSAPWSTSSKKKIVAAARKRAQARPDRVFFTAEEAFEEVALEHGSWNWALVAPDPDELQLSSGGRNGIEEMKESLSSFPLLYGLLRVQLVSQEKKKKRIVRYFLVQASNQEEEGNTGFTGKQRGQALSQLPKMEEHFNKFVKINGKLEINSSKECTVDFLLEFLEKSLKGPDESFATKACYDMGVEDFKEATPQLWKPAVEGRAAEAATMEDQAPRSAVAASLAKMETRDFDPANLPPEPEDEAGELDLGAKDEAPAAAEPDASVQDAEPARQRKPVKQYRVGDQVEVWSLRAHEWVPDGEVVERTEETVTRNGVKVPAGSVRVIYNKGRAFRWVHPVNIENVLRDSVRPRPPEPVTGMLLKQTHGWISEWHERYFEINKGYMQWWESQTQAETGEPGKSLYLLGARLLEYTSTFKLSCDGSKGVIYHFGPISKDKDENREWADTVLAHSEYCEELRELATASKKGREAMEDLAKSFAARRARRKSVREEKRKTLDMRTGK